MPWILLFVWVLNLWIMFAWPFDKVMSGVYWASLPEQLTGICADWVLVVTMLYLWLASSDRRPAFIRTHESQELNVSCNTLLQQVNFNSCSTTRPIPCPRGGTMMHAEHLLCMYVVLGLLIWRLIQVKLC